MNDETRWQAPGASAQADSPAPANDAPRQYAPPGWTPPPKPGLIPLRPLDLGTLLGAAFRVMRRNPRPTLGAALAIHGTSLALLAAVVGYASYSVVSRVNSSSAKDSGLIAAGAVGIIVLATLLPGLFVAVTSALLQAIIAFEVSRAALGEKPPFRQHWRHVKGRLPTLIGWIFLLLAALAVGFVVLFVFIAIATVAAEAGGQRAVGITIGVVLSLTLVAAFVWLAIKVTMVPSIIVIERASISRAISRSWSLTRNSFWRVFGITLLVEAILGAISQVATLPLAVIAPLLTTFIDPNGSGNDSVSSLALIFTGLSVIVGALIGTITALIKGSAISLLYLDLRMRREGLDLTLARYVENRQDAGEERTDPYLFIAAPPISTAPTQPPPPPPPPPPPGWS